MDNPVFYEVTAGEWAGETGAVVEYKTIFGMGRCALFAFDDGGLDFIPVERLRQLP